VLIECPRAAALPTWSRSGRQGDGEKIDKIIGKLAAANDLKGVIDQASFNDDDKLGKGRRWSTDSPSWSPSSTRSTSGRTCRGDDLLGDAYEYLMRHFATESGKSKASFYTPAEVSRILAKVIGVEGSKKLKGANDLRPTCGSGSLLLKCATRQRATSHSSARRKTWRHGRWPDEHDSPRPPTAELWKDNTLAAPYFKNKDGALKTFDFAVANPPSQTSLVQRARPGARRIRTLQGPWNPTRSERDYAFLLHLTKSSRATAKARSSCLRRVVPRQ